MDDNIGMAINEDNHISTNLEDFLDYLKSLVYKESLPKLEDILETRIINFSISSNTIFNIKDKYIWVKTVEFKQWINLIEKFNFVDAIKIEINYITGLIHPISDENRMMKSDMDGYFLYVKLIY